MKENWLIFEVNCTVMSFMYTLELVWYFSNRALVSYRNVTVNITFSNLRR